MGIVPDTRTRRAVLLCALASFACACSSESQRDRKIIEVFEKHSFEPHDSGRLADELRSRGPAALKLFDPYAVLLSGKPEAKPMARGADRPAPTGMLLGPCGASVCVLRVFRNSPADRAGLRDYDRIADAGGSGPSPEAVLRTISKGVSGISVLRRGTEASVAISPAQFSPPPVFGLYDPASRSAYIRLGMFYEGAAAVLEKGLDPYMGSSPRRVVLDLRYNRGGLPQEAAAVFRLFAAKGKKCFSLSSRHDGYSVSFPGGAGGPYSGRELAVLVNGDTSMAAEALASALKAGGAKLYGSRTRGSAAVLRSFQLDKNTSLRLAVARFLSPSGGELEGKGVVPDVEAEEPEGFGEMWRAPGEELFFRDAAWLAAVKG